MSNLVRGCLVVALATAAACSKASPAAPTGPVTPAIVLSIDALATDAAVVGTSVTLHVQATVAGASTQTPVGVVWQSSDERVARVDANGVMTPLAHGSVVISATARGTTATRTIDVVPSLSGPWMFNMECRFDIHNKLDENCHHATVVNNQRMVFTQTGSHVDGAWQLSSQRFAVTGRVDNAGNLRLEGKDQCHADRGGDPYSGQESLHDWHMNRGADGSYTGRATSEFLRYRGRECNQLLGAVPVPSELIFSRFRSTR